MCLDYLDISMSKEEDPMKRFSLLLLFAVAAMLVSGTSIAFNGYCPFTFPEINPFAPAQYIAFQMKQGWVDGELVWYICTDASDQQIACQQQFPLRTLVAQKANSVYCYDTINFAPRLTQAAGQVALLYVVTGQPQPVFTAVPGDATYSGVWQIVYVTFKPGVPRYCVNNADPYDPVSNPNGLPSAADAVFTATNKAGNPIVVKYPIMAVGPLGGPWQPAPGNTDIYRIPQGVACACYAYDKVIYLPFWNIYCQDPITKRVCVRQIVIPDACDPPGLPIEDQLVPKLGANDAPGLCDIDEAATQNFYWQLGPQPISQYPIVQECPSAYVCPCYNYNYDYTPIEKVVVFQRNVPPMAQSAVITNEPVLLSFLADGCLSEVRSSQIIDGTIIPARVMVISDTNNR